MSTEISLKQTWKNGTLVLERGSKKVQECVACVSLAAEERGLGRRLAGGTAQARQDAAIE